MPVEDNGLSAKDSGHGISLADKGGRVRAGFFLSESGSANVVLAGPDGRRRTPISDSRMTFDDSTGHKADAFKGVLTSGMRRRIFLRRRLEMPNAKNVNQTDSTREDGYLSEDSVQDHEAGLYPEAGRPQHISTLDAIDDEAVARFHEQGYLVVDRALDEEAVSEAGEALYDLIDGAIPGFRSVTVEASAREAYKSMDPASRRAVVRKVFNFVDVEPRLEKLMYRDDLLRVVGLLLGEEPMHLQDMALLKPARIGREKPWHQDMAYFNVPTDTVVVGVWIALDPATVQNGCMHVIPGSHRRGPHPHFKVRDWQICDTEVAVKESIPVPLDSGGILFWHGLTHHGSPSNRSDQGRRGIQLHYQPKSVGSLTTEERMQYYGGEGLGMTC